ncbi:MAG TPA: ATP-binding cassette domain-containing protein [Pusillimonas sp.]|uniref:ABC transporter ATP-binding protein n=1 Tax=Pusillimonas sp. TaxID=3040095 RepID=UPI002BEE3DA9|nr:ATP-binding cassette domain-containing protein [Pusillimonas sp.]HUH88889.1 ATP-binding cassette domain-containing protein [Pusillimonas sp.]
MRTQPSAALRDPLLEARNVSKRYGDFIALRDVSLSVNNGEVVSIVGPNGAGKTTLVNTLTGLFVPTTGEVRFLGEKLADNDIVKLSTQGLARAFQLVNIFPDLTVRETLSVAAGSYSGLRWRMLQNFRRNNAVQTIVEDIARAFGLHTSLDVLSSALPHGKRKLLDVASALALHPKVLLLDEPTAGVSTADKYGIMETLLAAAKKMNVGAIMLVEHDMDLVSRYSTRIIAMQDGAKIADSPAAEFFQNEEVLSIVVGKASH